MTWKENRFLLYNSYSKEGVIELITTVFADAAEEQQQVLL